MDGLRVLVLEDFPPMAEVIADMLADAGAIVVGTTYSVAAALDVLASRSIDLACLDINLGEEDSFPVADALASRRIPFVFVTAHNEGYLPARHRSQPLVRKSELAARLLAACSTAASRSGSREL